MHTAFSPSPLARLLLVLLGLSTLLLGACQKEDTIDYAARDEATIQQYLTDNKLTGFQRQSSGLYLAITQPGTGALAQRNQWVSAKYSASLLDGKVVDSNTSSYRLLDFALGQNTMIPGWEEGFTHLNKGAKATFLVPSGLAYGEIGAGPIPPNTVLRFDVEVVDIASSIDYAARDEATIQQYIADKKLTGFQRQPSGLYVAITQPGTGTAIQKGQRASALYTGTTLDGQVFDTTKPASPFSFTVGTGQVIAGWDEGFTLLNKGSKAILLLPSNLAYGNRAISALPANSILRFDVEVTDVK
ncbi:FKBP-type peptidyl-prolyl cis-trans isomerase [Hymenobacter sp. HSC-4F20]|uniref:FKBP-type peptidyl-prolyl cis-trans isomerase n=1 Tax=Hymenobacter sp. HSC-4F20 TaxID=2864135 RepID=UPI001C72E3B9|nr:FKBP-type peptidyl-prolyl cis-trans isomerase [Hymenobacter sp. HSC-4F20]MBX0292449.1 FKBP-type peptidyl-prolyl cis-trans isomerase [Hymenobacter sp. HSC-4F20]